MASYLIPAFDDAGGRTRAPGTLELVRVFLNTNDIEAADDAFVDPEALQSWLRARGLPGADARPTPADVRRVVRFREALRDLIDARTDGRRDDAARDELNTIAREAPLVASFSADGTAVLEPGAGGIDALVALILRAAAVSIVDGTWPRLKVCRNDACRWVFYDESRNRSGAWCTMAVCGNRMKGRAFRRRRAGSAPAS